MTEITPSPVQDRQGVPKDRRYTSLEIAILYRGANLGRSPRAPKGRQEFLT